MKLILLVIILIFLFAATVYILCSNIRIIFLGLKISKRRGGLKLTFGVDWIFLFIPFFFPNHAVIAMTEKLKDEDGNRFTAYHKRNRFLCLIYLFVIVPFSYTVLGFLLFI